MKKNFTMLELLAVIAAIATLIVAVLPTFSRRSCCSKAAKCKSNLKQIGTAVATYYSDSDTSVYPIKSFQKVSINDFDGQTIDSSIIKCPVDLKTEYRWFHKGTYYGTKDKLLAVDGWEHVGEYPRFAVYEDGHVSSVDNSEMVEWLLK